MGNYRSCFSASADKDGDGVSRSKKKNLPKKEEINMEKIFLKPIPKDRIKELIEDGKLLEAYTRLTDWENGVEDLFRPGKSDSFLPMERNKLREKYQEVGQLLDLLSERMWITIRGGILNAQPDNTQPVRDCFEIIYMEQARITAATFDPPGERPSANWKEMCFEVIQKTVEERLRGLGVESRSCNENWLSNHLVNLGKLTVLPDIFQIDLDATYYIEAYHKALSHHLKDLLDKEKLEGLDALNFLKWIMSHVCLKERRTKLSEWLANALKADVKDWHRETLPHMDMENCYYTDLAVIIPQMLDQNICHVNNCLKLSNYIKQLHTNYFENGLEDEEDNRKKLEEIIESTFVKTQKQSFGFFLKAIFDKIDIPKDVQLLKTKWIHDDKYFKSFCAVLAENCTKWDHMNCEAREMLVLTAIREVIDKYLLVIFGKSKTSFKNYEERVETMDKLEDVIRLLKNQLSTLAPRHEEPKLFLLSSLVGAIRLKDTEAFPLEIFTILQNHPHISKKQLMNAILVREDLNKKQAKKLIKSITG